MKIDERTTVSIGLLVVLAGVIMWLTRINYQNEAHAGAIAELKSNREKDIEIFQEVREVVIRIDERLKKRGSK